MKRLWMILSLIGLVLLMAACNTSGAADNDNTDQAAAADENDSEVPAGDSEEIANDTANEDDRDSVNKTGNSAENSNNENAGNDGKSGTSGGSTKPDKQSEVRDADSKPLTKEEAEELVRNHLELANRPEVKVQYDHDDNGRYVIQVYEVVGQGESSHTATLGWYYVDPKTQEIESMF